MQAGVAAQSRGKVARQSEVRRAARVVRRARGARLA